MSEAEKKTSKHPRETDAEAEKKPVEKAEKAEEKEPEKEPESSKAEQKLAKELAEEKERTLRLAAEYDNYKKRTVREKEELYDSAAGEIFRKLLPVFDNLDRARGCEDADTLRQGVEMILNSFDEALKSCGITEIDPVGKPFDPQYHEAVLHEQRDDFEENSVCEVLQKGYLLGDRVLRHAMVKVAN